LDQPSNFSVLIANDDDGFADGGDPIAVKRWLLEHEGYRFGA